MAKNPFNNRIKIDEPVEETQAQEVTKTPDEPKASKKKEEYTHVPGTVHLNAFVADVEEKKLKVAQAKAELEAAEAALEAKKEQ